jgi:alpha-tubulin suppressor-like RCC1 family protein
VATKVTAVAAGEYHSLFLKSDGSLWAMGANNFGQLGDGTYNQTNRPEQIVASGVTAIAAGYYHSLFLQSDGSLWAMGYNTSGQLGDGTYNQTNRPEQIVASGVTAIAAADDHSLFLKSDGSLWAMGYNAHGELGDGTYTKTNRPEQIVAGPPGYNRISIQLLSSDDVRLSYVGIAGTNYALDRRFTLSPANWVPLVTNPAGAGGVLMFTNTPNKATNNFWRIRAVP